VGFVLFSYLDIRDRKDRPTIHLVLANVVSYIANPKPILSYLLHADRGRCWSISQSSG